MGTLRAELEQETELKDLLEVSVSELRATVAELEKRLHSVENAENEWRTRLETQQELNGQLEQQICLVREKLEDLRGNPDDRLSSIRGYDAMPVDALKRILEQLTRDKASLQNQLTDCSLRIAQEAKAVPALVPGRRLQQMARPQEGKDSRMKRGLPVQTFKMADAEPVRKPARTSTTSSRLPRLKR
ncbi:coiled-coil domain containing 169 [Conger conger]|uniref:coiled-coil domain containing 169 n=1 Tax=Conger conger TaxID=82655 RepID=UPI002A59AA0D|nr:coiled-coil domain containing 169 [Conger conger]